MQMDIYRYQQHSGDLRSRSYIIKQERKLVEDTSTELHMPAVMLTSYLYRNKYAVLS